MIGRAGRPGFDTSAQAVVMVVEEKKVFYKKVGSDMDSVSRHFVKAYLSLLVIVSLYSISCRIMS